MKAILYSTQVSALSTPSSVPGTVPKRGVNEGGVVGGAGLATEPRGRGGCDLGFRAQ